jgi:hypothetical protein
LKDLIDKLFGALPMFSRQMLAMLSGPKTAIQQMDLESDSALQQALTFLAVSFGIAFIAQIPLLPEKQDKELLFGVLAVQSVLFFALNVAMTIVVWRVVGGRLDRRKAVVVTCYFSGVSTIIFLTFSLVAAGVFKTLDPILYQQVMTFNVIDPSSLLKSGGYRVFLDLLGVGFLATSAWILCVWGAYRELMQLSKLRSGIALSLFFALSPCLLLVQLLMAVTIANFRTTPAVPNELVGNWQGRWDKDSEGAHQIQTLQLTFAAPEFKIFPTGSYTMRTYDGTAKNKCLTTTTVQKSGRVAVQDSTIIFIPMVGTQLTSESCTGKSSPSSAALDKTEFQFKINQQPTGWTLCLNNRFGAALCLVAAK